MTFQVKLQLAALALLAIATRVTVKVRLTIPIQAVADCWSSGSCEPKGPTCKINKNNEGWQPLDVPNLFQTVSPALNEQASLNAKLVDYDLPVDFILKMAGLSGVVKVTPNNLSCDDKNLHC